MTTRRLAWPLLLALLCVTSARAELVFRAPLVSYDALGAMVHTLRGGAQSVPWQASSVYVLAAQMLSGGASLALHTYNASDGSDSLSEYSTHDGRLTRVVTQLHASVLDARQARQQFVLVERPLSTNTNLSPLVNASTAQNATGTVSPSPSSVPIKHRPSASAAPKPVLLVYSQAGRTLLAYGWHDGAYQGIAYRSNEPLRALLPLDDDANGTRMAWLSDTHVMLVHHSIDSVGVWTFSIVWRVPVPQPRLLAYDRASGVLSVVHEQADGRYAVLNMLCDAHATQVGAVQLPSADVYSVMPASTQQTSWLMAATDGTLRSYSAWPVDASSLLTSVRSSLLLQLPPSPLLLLGADVQAVSVDVTSALIVSAGNVASDSTHWPLSMRGNVHAAERTLVLDCAHELAVQDRGSLLFFDLDASSPRTLASNYLGYVALAPWPRLDAVDAYDTCQPSTWNDKASPLLLVRNTTHMLELDARTGQPLGSGTTLPCASEHVFYCGSRGVRRVCLVCATSDTLYVIEPHSAGTGATSYVLQPYAEPSVDATDALLIAALYDEKRDAAVLLHYSAQTLHVRRLPLAHAPARREWAAVATGVLGVALAATTSATVDVDGAIVLRVNDTHVARENAGHARWTLFANVHTHTSLRATRRAWTTHGVERRAWGGALSAMLVLCCVLPIALLGACLVWRVGRSRGWHLTLRRLERFVPYQQGHASSTSATCVPSCTRTATALIDVLRRAYTLMCCCCPSLVSTLDAHVVGERHQRMQEMALDMTADDFVYVSNNIGNGAGAGVHLPLNSSSSSLHQRRGSNVGSDTTTYSLPTGESVGVMASGSLSNIGKHKQQQSVKNRSNSAAAAAAADMSVRTPYTGHTLENVRLDDA